MTEPDKQMTHIAWATHFRGGKFPKWVEVGEGRIDVDSNGVATAHIFEARTVRGATGYTCLFPIGVRPPDPPPQAKRPGPSGEEEN